MISKNKIVFGSKIYYVLADEASAREFLQWKYEPPYEIYNYAPEHFEKNLAYHLDPSNNIHSMYREGELIGYCSFGKDARVPGGDYSEEALDIGLMIKPELTGQGSGSNYVKDVIEFAKAQFNPQRSRVTILGTNLRAQRVWEKNGFQKVQEFTREGDQLPFVILIRDA
jgi:RimJ/RimL family protein N-acetyltransferase